MAAGLGFKTFATGDVLSAADTNGYLMQGVLVFASAAARTSAITSPQEGQTSYLKDTDEIQVYSGSAWVTKSGGNSGLTVVKSETSFSAVTEIIADSVFTSTYSDYLIEMYWTSSSTSLLIMNLRSSGTNTSTNYNDQVTEALGTSIGTSYVTTPYVAHAINGSFYGSMRLNLFSPQKAEVTNFQSDSVVPSGAYTAPKITQMYGFQTASTQFDGIRLYVGNGAITGRYTIYGLSK
jgi:hypothetical protein